MSKPNKQVKPEPEVKQGEQNEVIETVEQVQENKPKKKITEATREHLAAISVKALKVKQKKKALLEKAKQLENAILELRADKYDAVLSEKTKKLKEKPNEEVIEVIEKHQPKKVKKIFKNSSGVRIRIKIITYCQSYSFNIILSELFFQFKSSY